MTRMNMTPQTMVYSASNTTATLVISTGTYAPGEVFGSNNGTTNGPGAIYLRAAMEPGGAGELVTLTLAGLTSTFPFNIWLFNAPLALANTNGYTFTLTNEDPRKFLGVVEITGTDYNTPAAGGFPMAYIGTGMTLFTAPTTQAIIAYMVPSSATTGDGLSPILTANFIHVS